MKKRTILGLAQLILLGFGMTRVQAEMTAILPFAPGSDPFTLTVDENGNATLTTPAGTSPLVGTLGADPTGRVAGNVLIYTFPAGTSGTPFATGDIVATEPNSPIGTVSDVVSATNAAGNLGAAFVGNELVFYSDPNEGDAKLDNADSGLPPANTYSANHVTVAEVGPENQNGFDYSASSPLAGTNTLHVISDTPEPSSIVLAGLGALCLVGYARRRRRRAVHAA